MARTKDTTLAERNRRICLYRRNGFTYSEIADMEEISRVRVAQIVAEANEELGEDDGRAEIGSLLEYAERKCVDLIEHPGFVCGPNGQVVHDPGGEPMANKGVAADALKTLMTIEDRKAKLFALDKPAKKPLPSEAEARQQMEATVAAIRAQKEADDGIVQLSRAEREELELLRQQLRVVPGQVIRELPSGQEP